jgi:membrane protease YdiL (CAAX protease family)
MRETLAEAVITSGVPPLATGDPERRRARQKIAIFLILVTAFAGALDVLRVLVPSGTNLIILTWTPRLADALAMWSVGIAGLIALAVIDRSLEDIGLRLGPPKYLFLALAIPITYCAAIYVPVWVLGLGRFAGTAALWTAMQSTLLHLPLRLLVAAGEEFGWRGVLVPNLARTVDIKLVAFLPGAIWALWHYPDILFFDYNVGTPFIFALTCFSVSLLGAGAFLSWLRLASNSIWPAVLFHAIHNSVISGIFDRVTEHNAMTFYFTTEFGAGQAVAGAVIGYLFWSKLNLRTVWAKNFKR